MLSNAIAFLFYYKDYAMNGMVADVAIRCNGEGRSVEIVGEPNTHDKMIIERKDCPIDKWEDAHVFANNSNDDSKLYWHPEIAWKAQWIGISSYSEVWCRKTFGKFKLTIFRSVP